jgi:hypothetical protein
VLLKHRHARIEVPSAESFSISDMHTSLYQRPNPRVELNKLVQGTTWCIQCELNPNPYLTCTRHGHTGTEGLVTYPSNIVPDANN